jgi:uncharacterized cupredoxin-like copper-binding protein
MTLQLSAYWAIGKPILRRFRQLGYGVLIIVIAAMCWMLPPQTAWADTPPIPVETEIHLGSSAGELKFEPSELHFNVGQYYKLVLDNPSPEKHYFTAKDFADAVWTQKVQVGGVEVKGAIHELELQSGAIAEWVVVPQRIGTYELHCSIPGHAEAGMIGRILVTE